MHIGVQKDWREIQEGTLYQLVRDMKMIHFYWFLPTTTFSVPSLTISMKLTSYRNLLCVCRIYLRRDSTRVPWQGDAERCGEGADTLQPESEAAGEMVRQMLTVSIGTQWDQHDRDTGKGKCNTGVSISIYLNKISIYSLYIEQWIRTKVFL